MGSAAFHQSGDAQCQECHDWYRDPGSSSEVLGDRHGAESREGGKISPGWEQWQPGSDKHAISKCTKLLKPLTRREECVKLSSPRWE